MAQSRAATKEQTMTRDHTPIEPRTRLLTALIPTGMRSPLLKPSYQWPTTPATK